jgi:hypothetical protein
MWADVKLVVADKGGSSHWGTYRQAVAVDGPSGAAPSTPACGTLSETEQAALIAAAKTAFSGGGGSATGAALVTTPASLRERG